jgi:hypothetical protein
LSNEVLNWFKIYQNSENLDIFYEYRKISFGIMKYRWSPRKPVFGEISEISAEKKNPAKLSSVDWFVYKMVMESHICRICRVRSTMVASTHRLPQEHTSTLKVKFANSNFSVMPSVGWLSGQQRRTLGTTSCFQMPCPARSARTTTRLMEDRLLGMGAGTQARPIPT